jgi:PEP-CTERM motif
VTITGPEIIFTAPPGTSLAPSDNYQSAILFVNTDVTGANSGFSAEFTYSRARGTPEPSTWAMMAIGFATLGVVGWRGSRRTVAKAA